MDFVRRTCSPSLPNEQRFDTTDCKSVVPLRINKPSEKRCLQHWTLVRGANHDYGPRSLSRYWRRLASICSVLLKAASKSARCSSAESV
jgi:hypothetical protein